MKRARIGWGLTALCLGATVNLYAQTGGGTAPPGGGPGGSGLTAPKYATGSDTGVVFGGMTGGGAFGMRGSGSGVNILNARTQARQRAEAMMQRVEAKRREMDRLEQQHKSGLAPTEKLEGATAEYEQMRLEIRNALEEADALEELARLFNPVDVDMEGAPLATVVSMLTKATGLKVELDKGVRSNVKINMKASRIPFAQALSAIAQNADLSIGKTSGGVVLRNWPFMEMNGARQSYRTGAAPWSDEWGGYAFDLPRDPNPQKAPILSDVPYVGNFFNPTFSANSLSKPSAIPPAGWGGVIISASSDSVAITEPGLDAQGRPGYWITLYRRKGAALEQAARGFHLATPLVPPRPTQK